MDVAATFEIRLLASILILIPAVVGLGLHFLLAFTLFRNWKTFHTVSFYVITVQTQWCDICALLLDLYVAFPLTLTGDQYMGDSIALYYGPLFFEGIAFNGLFLLSFFLSLNRFLLFIFPHMHNRLFTYWGTRIMSLILWILVFLFIGFSNYFGCRKQFSKDDFYFWYNCSNQVPGEFHYSDFMHIVSNVVPLTMIVMYVIVFLKIRMSLIVWIIVFLFIGLSNYFGCRKQFAKDDFYFWYNCSNRVPGEFHYNDFMHIASNIVPITMIVMYVIIYVKIRHAIHDSEMARVKQEIKFFVQVIDHTPSQYGLRTW
ncbi:unnamed protein product [Haemonchus placei]|uniref:7TM_GPCR_Srx domain-containing protein n=1 Tax=Haemonchus placei TaxID=6290 RepID=A0A0N4X030_HAEPC|nr:unnamed protein product [Haemonchus placei]